MDRATQQCPVNRADTLPSAGFIRRCSFVGGFTPGGLARRQRSRVYTPKSALPSQPARPLMDRANKQRPVNRAGTLPSAGFIRRRSLAGGFTPGGLARRLPAATIPCVHTQVGLAQPARPTMNGSGYSAAPGQPGWHAALSRIHPALLVSRRVYPRRSCPAATILCVHTQVGLAQPAHFAAPGEVPIGSTESPGSASPLLRINLLGMAGKAGWVNRPSPC